MAFTSRSYTDTTGQATTACVVACDVCGTTWHGRLPGYPTAAAARRWFARSGWTTHPTPDGLGHLVPGDACPACGPPTPLRLRPPRHTNRSTRYGHCHR